MASENAAPGERYNCPVHVQLTRSLLRQLDTLRESIQADAAGSKAISRGDVVRLALRRMYASYLLHLAETNQAPQGIDLAWMDLAQDIFAEGTCPSWLVPGRPEPDPAPRKKGR